LRVFARNGARQREVGFREDIGVRMRRLRGRFGAACGSTSGANRLKQDSVAMKIKELLLAAFTYFAPALQEAVLERIAASLEPRGFLVIGSHEHLAKKGSKWSPFGDSRTILEDAVQ
jgi:hypothetical protein